MNERSIVNEPTNRELQRSRGFAEYKLIEIVPYFQHYRMLDKWHSVPLVIRLLAYATLVVMQYTVSKSLQKEGLGSISTGTFGVDNSCYIKLDV
ncbi:MAG: hypothetical protein ABI581_14865 [Sediminibacterium sp.]